ncbi:MAG: FecR domain-containing protein [Polyangiaceae bacterium]
MNIPRFASAAAKLLRDSLPEVRPTAGARARGIATIERAMLARARRRRLKWAGAAVLSAAAAVSLVSAGRWMSTRPDTDAEVSINVTPAGHGAALRAGARAEALPERAELASGQRIETPSDGGALLRLSTGTSMDLGGSTSFRVDSQGKVERFSLQQGELSAHVAKLSGGQRFIIATPDAEVEVRGTKFRVRVLGAGETCGAGSRTRLDVTEGIVEVRASGATVNVVAGEHWPSDCTDAELTRSVAAPLSLPRAAPVPDVSAVPLHAQAARPFASSSAEHAPLVRGAPEQASELAQQNDSFAEGVALHRQGDVAGALRAFQSFLVRFPRSPLAENALVERMRILASAHDPGARTEAQRYVARYPRGFALGEAKQLTEAP